MKPERIQDRWTEKPEWIERPAGLERRWPCEDFVHAARLARVAHQALVDSPVLKEVMASDSELVVRLALEDPASEALFHTRDRLEGAVAVAEARL